MELHDKEEHEEQNDGWLFAIHTCWVWEGFLRRTLFYPSGYMSRKIKRWEAFSKYQWFRSTPIEDDIMKYLTSNIERLKMCDQFVGDGEILAFVLMEPVDRWMMNLINIESMTCCYKVLYMLLQVTANNKIWIMSVPYPAAIRPLLSGLAAHYCAGNNCKSSR